MGPISKSLSVALALLGIWWALIIWIRPNGSLFGQNHLQRNLIRAQEYLYHNPQKRVIIIGSSLSERIPEGLVGPECVNLGFVKDNAITGSEIIRRAGLKPSLVLVEASVENPNGIGEPLLQTLFSVKARLLVSHTRLFEDRYQPATALLGAVRSMLLGGRDPNEIAGSGRKGRGRQLRDPQGDADSDVDKARSNAFLDSLRLSLGALRNKGVCVVFFEPPIDPAIRNTRDQSELLRQFESVFPVADWPRIRLPPEAAYETTDGYHMVRRSAERYAMFLRSQIEAYLPPDNRSTAPR